MTDVLAHSEPAVDGVGVYEMGVQEVRFHDAAPVDGEVLTVSERVIIAPVPGRFRPVDPQEATSGLVEEQVIGFIDGAGHSTPVRSAFSGLLMGLLAHAGERVREGQPVAWLRQA